MLTILNAFLLLYYVVLSKVLSVAINQPCEWSGTWQFSMAVQKCFTCSICSHRFGIKTDL